MLTLKEINAGFMSDILLLNGPNLNLLGQREPEHYGVKTLSDIENQQIQKANQYGFHLVAYQSNSESQLIDKIHQTWQSQTQIIIFNPAAFTHTSIALRDALLSVHLPFIEIHISNIYQRESCRQHSYFSDIAYGIIIGFGYQGYNLATMQAINYCLFYQKNE